MLKYGKVELFVQSHRTENPKDLGERSSLVSLDSVLFF